ncbi:pentatricopeptide repeat-containing protein At2g36730 [Coffea eugenioides]|uniref:pentatricopeptide repeat-containing protein At2g36730 n=1 Tax=Coffea eugenioides TaxID=49369 RepID=UPI000F5D2B36|nr:pentatricopeptide repeat-containing protein At2g36730-like [Coffea arabica]XP_027163290.1 pentatricopeptide repeat-containing protein At2g36730 [Coffea eugenioides]
MPRCWNDLIRAYATSKGGLQREALRVFLSMRRSGALPNEYTFPFLFKACASVLGLYDGRQIHADVKKRGLDANVYVQNTLIHFYGSCRKIVDAHKVFDEMSYRTVVSWNSILSAFVENSWFREAIEVFLSMRSSELEPDETTMVILLSTCAEMGNLSLGKWIHSQVIVTAMVVNCQLGTALVDMYGKCGIVDYARLVFNGMSDRNVWTWSAMIMGSAQHGFAFQALQFFKAMKNNSLIEPNYVTYLGVLCACSHAGLVDYGRRFFYEMEHIHGIKPMMVHCAVMVDILGRAGHLEEAYNFILSMPTMADATIWRTLLSACNIHDINDRTGLAEKVRQKLLELEPRRSGNLVMVANKYAEVGMWEKAESLRRSMRNVGLKKTAGESCIEIGGSIFRFFSGNDFYVANREILLLIDRLNLHTRMMVNCHK